MAYGCCATHDNHEHTDRRARVYELGSCNPLGPPRTELTRCQSLQEEHGYFDVLVSGLVMHEEMSARFKL